MDRARLLALAVFVAVSLAADPAIAQPVPPATAPPPADQPDCTVEPLWPGACEWPPDDPPATIPSPAQPPFWDLNGRIVNAVNQWVIGIINSAFEWVLSLLAGSLITTPRVQANARVRRFWGWSLGLADILLALLWVLGAGVVMGYQTVQTRYSAKEVAPKAVLAVLAANLSMVISEQAIRLTNALSRALLRSGFQAGAFTGRLRQVTVNAVVENGEVVLLMGLVLVVLTVVLLLYAVLRNALVVLLVVAGPLALACHSLPGLDRAAALWWRALAGCLGVQLAQALTLAAATRVFFQDGGLALLGLDSPNLLADLVVASALLLLLVLEPLWALRLVLRGRRGVAVRVALTRQPEKHADVIERVLRDGFNSTISAAVKRERDRDKRRIEREAKLKELEDAGARIAPEDWAKRGGRRIDPTDGKALNLDPKQHATEPCHAVYVTATAQVEPICMEPARHAKPAEGKPAASKATSKPVTTGTKPATKPEAAPTDAEAPGTTKPAAEPSASPAKAAEDASAEVVATIDPREAEKAAHVEALRQAATERQAMVRAWLTGRRKLSRPVTDRYVFGQFLRLSLREIGEVDLDYLGDVLGLDDESADVVTAVERLAAEDEEKLRRVAVALICELVESHIKEGDYHSAMVTSHYSLLTGELGYELSEAELAELDQPIPAT